MRSHRVFRGLIVGAMAAALIASGCKKDEDESADKDDDDDTEVAEGDNGDDGADGADPAGAVAAMPPAASYQVFPADSEVLFGLAFEPVRQSELWQTYRDTIMTMLDEEGDLSQLQEACGFDPFAELQSVMFGGSTADDDRMVVVVHGFSRDEITSCAESVAELSDEEFAVTEDGDLAHYNFGGDEIWVAWLDDNTLVTGPRAESDKEWIAARAAGDDGLGTDSALTELVGNDVDQGAGLWFGVIPADDSPMGSGMAMGGGPQPEAIYGSVSPADGLAIDLGLRFGSAEEANSVLEETQGMLQMVKMQMGELGQFVDKTKMSVENHDMLVSLSLTDQELGELVEGVGAMFGGMMGGMGGGGGMPH